ncbi:MAG: hypothetical protein KJ747_08570 [Actinobacteria bacterium]|nr:hypothetical protein [Actinomycetota bacterium]MCG2807177.1 hypothetical protein [Coriobacteriia bacterium]
MKPTTTVATPSMLDTYGMTYAFTALLLVAGLFTIDRLSIVMYSPVYLALIAAPFMLGPAIVFAIDSPGSMRTVLRRSAVLAPLTLLTGVTLLFLAMIVIILPLSFWVMPHYSASLTPLFVAALVLVAAPMVVSFVSRIREGISVSGLIQMAVLLVVAAMVAWIIVETFAPGDTLYTFLRKDVAKHFTGGFAWYLPALALAAGLWRRAEII